MATGTDLPPWLFWHLIRSRAGDFGGVGTPPADLLSAWLEFDIGDRLDRINALAEHPQEDVRLVIEGYTETIRHRGWQAQLNPEPFDTWRIAVVSDPTAPEDRPRIGSGTAVLAAGINTTDTSLSVTTGNGGLWTTSVADFPMDINVDGERIRLSAISGGSSPQTFTVSARSVNGAVMAHAAGDSVEVWQPARIGL
jgi:hypothetical protein